MLFFSNSKYHPILATSHSKFKGPDCIWHDYSATVLLSTSSHQGYLLNNKWNFIKQAAMKDMIFMIRFWSDLTLFCLIAILQNELHNFGIVNILDTIFWLIVLRYNRKATLKELILFFSKKLFFVAISETINISGKRTLFWDHLEKIDFCLKNLFLALSSKPSIFRGKGRYFEIILEKLIFAQKTVFCLYLLNYQYFGENGDILR